MYLFKIVFYISSGHISDHIVGIHYNHYIKGRISIPWCSLLLCAIYCSHFVLKLSYVIKCLLNVCHASVGILIDISDFVHKHLTKRWIDIASDSVYCMDLVDTLSAIKLATWLERNLTWQYEGVGKSMSVSNTQSPDY